MTAQAETNIIERRDLGSWGSNGTKPEPTPAPDPQSMASLYKKIAQVMGMVNRVAKDGRNNDQKYNYATAEDLYDEARRAMAEVGLAFMPTMDSVEQESSGKGLRTTVWYTFTLACGDTGATKEFRWKGEAVDYGMADKGIAKASTIAIKYFLRHVFLISTGEDADATEAPKNGQESQPTPDTRPYEHQLADKLEFLTDNHAHTVNVIKSLLEGDTVNEADALWVNAIKVMYHRALDKFGFDEECIAAILAAEVDDCTGLTDWLRNHKRPLDQAWELIIAAHDLKDDKPAKPQHDEASQETAQPELIATPKKAGKSKAAQRQFGDG